MKGAVLQGIKQINAFITVFFYDGKSDQIGRRTYQYGFILIQCGCVNRIFQAAAAYNLQVRRAADIEHGNLNALLYSAVRIRLIADPKKRLRVPDMQIVGVACYLQLAHDLRILRIGQIHGKQRIHVAVGYKINHVLEIAGGID